MQTALVFSRFERFWHWTQAALIIGLMVTGFEVHGTYHWLGFEQASSLHQTLAWALIILWVFAIFWHLTTGEWRQYVPTAESLVAVVRYYTVGIFQKGVPHPYKKTRRAKHNPLQRLAYLGFKLLISPLIWVTGLLYMYYNDWSVIGLGGLSLGTIAFLHTLAAFAMLVFFVGHVYMAAFTGHPWYSYLKGMVTGYEEVEE